MVVSEVIKMQEKIGSVLRNEREKAGLTIDEVSEKLGFLGYKVSPKTLYGYENDVSSPKISLFMKICQLYGINDIYATFNMQPPEDSKPLNTSLSFHERELVIAYRSQPEMQEAVDRLLKISSPATEVLKQA